jgi:hypothetical protein
MIAERQQTYGYWIRYHDALLSTAKIHCTSSTETLRAYLTVKNNAE